MKNFYPKWQIPAKLLQAVTLFIIIAGLVAILPAKLFAQQQPPTISYASPAQPYKVGTAITPLVPTDNNLYGIQKDTGVDREGANLNHPLGIAPDTDSYNFYATDSGNKLIKRYDWRTGYHTVYSGYTCTGIAVDAAGSVYFSNYDLNSVMKLPAGGGAPVTLATNIFQPYGVAVDLSGNVYVASAGSKAVYKIPVAGGSPIQLVGGLVFPTGVAVDHQGNVFIADGGLGAVSSGYLYDAKGNPYYTDDGQGTIVEYKPADNTATAEYLVNHCYGVAVDGMGHVYVSTIDPNYPANNAIFQFPALTAEKGNFGLILKQPALISCDPFGNVYIPESTGNNLNEIYHTGGVDIDDLPDGLSFDNTTGTLSGTPTASSTAKTYTVRAYAGGYRVQTTFILSIANNNAQLSALGLSSGTITPALTPAKTAYTINQDPVQESLIITPVCTDRNAVITVNGTVVQSSRPSAAIPTPVGASTIKITITPALGPVITDTLTVNRPTTTSPTLAYATPQKYSIGTAIAPLTPTSAHVAAPGYNPVTIGSGFHSPNAVAVDLAGNLYVSDTQNGRVVEIPAGNGTPKILYSGYSVTGIAVDAGGDVFVANYDAAQLIEIPAGGAPKVLTQGLQQPAGVAVDAAGYIYVACTSNNSVYKIQPLGGPGQVIASGFGKVEGLAVDAQRNVYAADFNANAVYKISPGGNKTVYVNVTAPAGVALNGAGDLFVTDFTDNRLIKVPADGSANQTTQLSSTQPYMLASDAFGNLYLPFLASSNIVEMAITGGYFAGQLPPGLHLDNTTGIISGTPLTDSKAANYSIRAYNGNIFTTAALNIEIAGNGALSALAISSGTLIPAFSPATASYAVSVADSVENVTVTPATADLNCIIAFNGTTIASGVASANIPLAVGSNTITVTGTPADGTVDIYTITVTRAMAGAPTLSYNSPQVYQVGTTITPLTPASHDIFAPSYTTSVFDSGIRPTSGSETVAADAAGNVYVGDSGSGRLIKYTGGTGSGTTILTGVNVSGLAIDKAGNIYYCDGQLNTVSKIPVGGVATTIASGITWPIGLAVDASGNVYVASQGKGAIYKIPAAGGAASVVASGLDLASGVTVDPSGNIYYADGAFDGTVPSLFKITGSGTAIALPCFFNQPVALTSDASGNIFACNLGDGTVEEVFAGTTNTKIIASGISRSFSIAADPTGNIYTSIYNTPARASQIIKIARTGGFQVNPALPQGLSLDNLTGIISGTPVASAAATNYTINGANSSGSVSATVNIKVSGSTLLSNLTASTGVFALGFVPSHPTYTITAGADQNTINFIPTVLDNAATIQVNGQTVISGQPSQAITLTGFNTVTIIVTGTDGSSTTYTLYVFKPLSIVNYASPQVYYQNMAITPLTPSGSGIGAPGGYGSTVIGSGINYPIGMSVDGNDNVYFADESEDLWEIPVTGGGAQIIGSAASATATDAAGNLYFVGFHVSTVTKRAPNGATSSLGSGLVRPSSVVVDAAGNVYVADSGNIIKIAAGTNQTSIIGNVAGAFVVAIDPAGNVYTGSQNTNSITEFPASGASAFTFASGFSLIAAIAADRYGNIWVSDQNTGDVYMVPAGGGATQTILTNIFQPLAMTVDMNGSIYVSQQNSGGTDYSSHILKYTRNGGYYLTQGTLPAGLSLNNTTGVISGTPGAGSPATNYTVTGYTSSGGNPATVNIKVKSAYLSNLTINQGSFWPAFSMTTTNYADTVCSGITSMQITPTAGIAGSVITINGTVVTSGVATAAIPLVVGPNPILIRVIKGDTTSYSLNIVRLPVPVVNITSTLCTTCSPQTLSFVATVQSDGSTPIYTWYKNNVVAGTNSNLYVDNALVPGDQVWCTVSTQASCVLQNAAVSNIITLAAPSIASFSPSSGPIGTLLTIKGSNLNTLTTLSVGGVAAIPVSNSGTQLTAMVMPGTIAGTVAMTSVYGNASAAGSFTVTPSQIPNTPQGGKLIGSAGYSKPRQGAAVALSADGNAALVGIPSDNTSGGGAFVFSRSNGIWTQQAKIAGTGSALTTGQGTAVSLSADGTTALITNPSDRNTLGEAWVFTLINGVWTQQGSYFTPSDALAGTGFGTAASLSADGNTALIGGQYDNNNAGAIWIYKRINGTWIQQGNKLTPSDAVAGIIYFGGTTAISADGNTAVIGGYYDKSRTGAIWIFTNNNGTWMQQGGKINATGATGTGLGPELGTSVAISADGNTVMAGGSRDNNAVGAAWVFTRSGTTWTQQGAKLLGTGEASNGNPIYFGTVVSLSADGNTAVISAADDNSHVGAYWVFTRTAGAWTQQGNKITGSGELAGLSGLSGFGTSLAISADGLTAFAGDPNDNVNAGATWAFIPAPLPTLSNLSLSSGTLSPVFAGATNSYTESVNNTINLIGVTPSATDPTSTIKVNGVTVTSGTTSGPIALNVGQNTVTITVTAQDGITINTYSVTITRGLSANATLSALIPGTGTLSPAFSANITNYTAVANTSAITITPTTADPAATLTVNGSSLASGTTSAAIALNVGANTITTTVTAQDGTTTQTYTLTVTRPSNNANLSNLSISSGTLSPVFVGTTSSYTANVSYATTSITVTPSVAANANSTISVNGTIITSGAASAPIALNLGANTITTTVTAQDGINTNTYTLVVTRLSNNANLANLTGSAVLSPAFAQATTAYTASVSSPNPIITLMPTVADTTATVKINGVAVAPGAISAPVTLTAGSNTIPIVVTAGDGTLKTYTVTVTATVILPPNISYGSPQTYYPNLAIPALKPTNTGGAVPTTTYDYTNLFAGSGMQGSANGTGNAASFKYPIGIAADVQGNLYVCDAANNLIREVTPDGVVTTFAGSGVAGAANGAAASASFNNPTGIVVDAQGNVYVGDEGNNLIRKITGGMVSTLAGSGTAGTVNDTGTAASFNHPRGLAINAQGDVYVADYYNNLIRKITAAGVVTTFAGSGTAGAANGTGTAASFNAPLGVATDILGNVYVADGQNRLIREITPAGVVSTLAGSGSNGAADGTGTAATFGLPFSVTTDLMSNVYVTDMTNNSIRKITPAGVVTTLAGGTSGFASGIGTQAMFNLPQGIASDNQGSLYIADDGNQVIRRLYITGYSVSPALPPGLSFDATSGVISGVPTSASAATNYSITAYNIGGSGTASLNISVTATTPPAISYAGPQSYLINAAIAPLSPTNTGGAFDLSTFPLVSNLAGQGNCGLADGTAAGAYFCNPTGVATDTQGNIYVADQTYNLIRKITPAGVVTTLAGTGSPGFVNNPGTAASFNNPLGIAVDNQGNVYVVDGNNQAIRKITSAGVVTTLAGNGTASSVNGVGTAATFNYPYGVAVDLQGNVYVAELGAKLIRKITPDGTVSTLAGGGPGSSTDATGTAASFSSPYGIGTDAQGNVYVADLGGNKIRKITPGGTVTTLAGTGATGSLNGAGTVATFSGPAGVATDSHGNIYVVETGTNEVRKITPAGVVTTIAGNGSAGSANSIGIAATFNYPRGLTVDPNGIIYVADNGNNKIRKIIQTPYSVSPALPAGLSFDVGTGTIAGTPTALSAPTTYTVAATNNAATAYATVNIAVVAPDVSLSALTISAGTLSPVFASGTTVYTAMVGNTNTTLKVKPTANDPNTTITVNGVAVTSGALTDAIALAVGTNTITTVVTAQDGVSTKTYTITVTRESNDATLSALSISNGTLSPVFAKNTITYSALVGNSVSAITLTPVKNNAFATISVNGSAVTSGTASPAQNLVVGPNVVQVVVTAQNTAVKTYTVTVTRQSNDATLSALALSSGTLNPVFAGTTVNYTASVNYDISSITFTPTQNNVFASISVNGSAVTSGTASSAQALGVGTNLIPVVVTAQNGATKTYKVTVTRLAASAVATLSNLGISSGILSPAFSPGTIAYADTVNNSLASITVMPTQTDVNAITRVNGVVTNPGTASASIPIVVGANAINIVVTAQNGTITKTYTVTVMRKSNDATLSALTLSTGTLNPVFAGSSVNYTASVSNTTTSITVTPVKNNSYATISVNGSAVNSGGASTSQALALGANTIKVVVTAQNGAVKTYTITVTRVLSPIATLSNLTISSGILSPAFVSGTTAYADTVNNSLASITLIPTQTEVNAVTRVNGMVLNSGSASAAIPLIVGPNTINIVVTAPDGTTTKTYTVAVIRKSNDATLSALTLSSGTLSPVFAGTTVNYTASVNYAVSSITLTPTKNNVYASITINGSVVNSGSASPAQALVLGANLIHVIVTAQNGATKTYNITVTRLPASTVATLSNLAVNSGILSPVFSPGTISYTDSVSNATASVMVVPTQSDIYASIQVNGTTVVSGQASANIPLSIATNTITIVVTAQDGITTKTYTLKVTRLSNNADLSNLVLSSGTLTPVFASATIAYAASVSNTTSSITLKPTKSNGNSTISIKGIAVASGKASAAQALTVGVNTINVDVTAQNGKVKTYTVTVTRASGGLNSIYLPGSGEQTPLVTSLNPKVEANNILSPNGDGINDIWVVKNIAFYPNNTVTVYNRAGEVVFTRKGYANDWDGSYRGSVLSEGSYYYLIELGNGENIKGFITVVRDR